MPTQQQSAGPPLWGRYCDGGHYCSAPKECCTLGCCYPTATPLLPSSSSGGGAGAGGGVEQQHQQQRPVVGTGAGVGAGAVPPLLDVGGATTWWFVWAILTLAVVCLAFACSVWRFCRRYYYHRLAHRTGSGSGMFGRRGVGRGGVCGGSGVGVVCGGGLAGDRTSLPDSAGSCYAPPGYSRCNSFLRPPPPPYAEVTSKPDLYPLVIGCDGAADKQFGGGGGSTSYLMVQYFRNYILRPTTGSSLSATSTIDSLSSSFLCNAANEANSVVPPPYSCTGSLETFQHVTSATPDLTDANGTCLSDHQHQQQQQQQEPIDLPSPSSATAAASLASSASHNKQNGSRCTATEEWCLRRQLLQYGSSHHHQQQQQPQQHGGDSLDSDDHNFSDLLNLSVCVPSEEGTSVEGTPQHGVSCAPSGTVTGAGNSTSSDMQHHHHQHQSYSIANSVTVSDISSLANLGTPDSPPRATSPTIEIRELLDKIQQLPQPRSPDWNQSATTTAHKNAGGGRLFSTTMVSVSGPKSKKKTLYMPLNTGTGSSRSNKQHQQHHHQQQQHNASSGGHLSLSGRARCWLSRSAPSTPCCVAPGQTMPFFPSHHHTNNATPTTTTANGNSKCRRSVTGSRGDGAHRRLLLCDDDDDDTSEDDGAAHRDRDECL